MNFNNDEDDDDDSERTELYTPPPMNSEENSIIVLDESVEASSPATMARIELNEKVEHLTVSSNSISNFDFNFNFNADSNSSSNPNFDSNLKSDSTLKSKTNTRTKTKKRQKQKKSMSEYRPPSPFSPKPDYKSMDIEQLKTIGSRYGLATNLSKGRLVKILDEIYTVTHQYETDTDFDWEEQEHEEEKTNDDQTFTKGLKRPAVHQMSSSDENDENEGRFLELTLHEAALSASSSSSSTSSPTLSTSPKTKRPKLQTPTMPLKEMLRNYIEAKPSLHAQILSYEPIDFEDFHKQMKSDLMMKIVSKDLMKCLDDQCITFTLRSRKGAFTSVMRAKRRQK